MDIGDTVITRKGTWGKVRGLHRDWRGRLIAKLAAFKEGYTWHVYAEDIVLVIRAKEGK